MRMYFVSPVFMLSALFFSCGGNNETSTGEQKEFTTDAPPETDSLIVLNPIADSVRLAMQDYFSPGMITKIEALLTDFNALQTDTAFEMWYDSGMKLIADLDHEFADPQTAHVKELVAENEYDIFPIVDELQQFNGKLGPLFFGCVAECSMLDFCFDLNLLNEKALTTNGKADDDFTSLVDFIDEDYGYAGYAGFKVWHHQYWDYGGSNLIGDGTMLDCVQRLQKFKKTHTLFKSQFELVHSDVFGALSDGHSYEYSVEEVLAEYNKIFKLNYFTGEELEAIQAFYTKLKEHPEEFQFSCEDGNCSWG